jgi:RimJ/RimL family protein N-acetyltransferase
MAELAFDAHISWLNATLADPLRQLFIVEEDGRPIGTVRVDQEANGSAELSWTVAPEARGRGMAKRMVRLVADEVSGARGVRAEVKAGNEASIKVAEAAGMRLSRQEGEVLHFARPGSTHKG